MNTLNTPERDTDLTRDIALSSVVASYEDVPSRIDYSAAPCVKLDRIKPVEREQDEYEEAGLEYVAGISRSFQRKRWDRMYLNQPVIMENS